MMDAARIEALLVERGARVGLPLTLVDETTSTNDDAKRAAADGAPHGACFIAETQTAGRGRGAHRWHSPKGENVYLSVVLRPAIDAAAAAPLALVAGVAVARVVDVIVGDKHPAAIKWPNDVYVDDHKIAGVLVEATTRGPSLELVIGIGLNVLTKDFSPFGEAFATPPTSLAAHTDGAIDREALCAQLLVELGALGDVYARDGMACVHAELIRRDWLRGRRVRVEDREGTAEGIDAGGRLIVDGRAIVSGEVSVA
jgi:BirA family biotin operon repressor/biotin-[acetyl-CoA-carboxylase] ligase